MNQTTNLIQWKNFTDEQKAEHDFEGYEYEFQRHDTTQWMDNNQGINEGRVYRLVIQPEKWYFCALDYTNVAGLKLGKDISTKYDTLRPATAAEIPEPKATLEDRVKSEYADFDVVMFDFAPNFLKMLSGGGEGLCHVMAQSMRWFFDYVYLEDDEFYLKDGPTYNGLQPIGALFMRDGE